VPVKTVRRTRSGAAAGLIAPARYGSIDGGDQCGLNQMKQLRLGLALLVAAGIAAPLQAGQTDGDGADVMQALAFTRVVYTHETRPDLAAAALRYAASREGQPLRLRLRRAEDHFQAGRAGAALRHYALPAWYGDKYAQFQIGRIHLFGMADQPRDPVEGLAWLAIAAEHPEVRSEVEPWMAEAWRDLDAAARGRARHRVVELARDYSNLAVLDRVEEYLAERLRERTGTRLSSASGGMLASTEGAAEYQRIRHQRRGIRKLLDEIGSVELGRFVVLEPLQREPSEP